MTANPSKKILIVEDDPFLVKILYRRLLEENFDVEKVTNGQAAEEKLKKNEYACVLMDVMMPVKNGFEVLTDLKKTKKQVNVLVFSNLSEPQDEQKALSLGAKAYFIKSDISIDEVIAAVKRFTA